MKNQKEKAQKTRCVSLRIILLCCISCSMFLGEAQELSFTGDSTSIAQFKQELERLGETSGGTMGVAVHHLETGTSIQVNGNEIYPMASTYKVPVAVTLLKQVDSGEKKLTDMVEVPRHHMGMAYGITEHLFNPGIILSLHNFLEPMLMSSDNTSTDVLMEVVGGPDLITKTIREEDIDSLTVSRNTATLIRDYFNFSQPAEGEKRSLLEDMKGYTEEEIAELSMTVRTDFADDGKDTASPVAMAKLLQKIWSGKILSPTSTEIIKDIMLRCRTGEERLKGILPKGTPVAHKTGTIGGTSNDAGVITLPNQKGHVVIVVYIKDSPLDYAQRDRAIAEAARAAHDYFIFNTVKN